MTDPTRARAEAAARAFAEHMWGPWDTLIGCGQEDVLLAATAALAAADAISPDSRIAELEAEVERLQSYSALRAQDMITLDGMRQEAQAENARLREALTEVKLLCLTAGSIGHPPVVRAMQRMIRLCIDAGVTQQLPELLRAALERKEVDRGTPGQDSGGER